jgi:hypothetical protein
VLSPQGTSGFFAVQLFLASLPKSASKRRRRQKLWKKLNGREALLRVRDGKPRTDAEHRVPTESDLPAQTNYFTPPLASWFRACGT